ncbi:MAG: sulfite exporter TauE/SafE family protein [Clostridia bacterium]|nr:sulfite exporter TauE/SafE family protein [Clostridia bacterium]
MKEKKKAILLIPIAAISGFCNALLGAGGGILLSLTLGKIYEDTIPDRRDVLVNAQASMIAGCALSAFIYTSRDGLDLDRFSVFAIPAIIGGVIGSILLTKINAKAIGRIFALLVIWSGLRMLLRG